MTITANRFMVKNGLDNNSKTITNVADPVNASDAATRAYVLANAGGSQTLATVTANGNTTATMMISTNASTQSLTDGAMWFNQAGGAILFDDSAHKRISWNDGGGNFNIRSGNYQSATGTLYAKGAADSNGGATVISMTTDGADGNIFLGAAPIGVPGATVSSTTTLNIHSTLGSYFTGNVGIGGTPSTKLHLTGATQTLRIQDTGANGNTLDILVSNTEIRLQGTATVNAAHPMTFWTNNAERMRIEANGNVNIWGGMLSSSDMTSSRASAPTTGYIYFGNTGTKYVGFDGTNFVSSMNNNFSILGNAATSSSCSGNAATASNLLATGSTWSTYGTQTACVGQLVWKNYGNGHSIFDASAGTSPTGSAVNSTNSTSVWQASFPTLMGWNGSQTYGVRVDSARLADSATTAANYLPLAGGTMSGNIAMGGGANSINWTGIGTSYIANGPGDGASYGTYNLRIQSHWGIGFPAYDNVNRIVFDTRSGHISAVGNGSFSGSLTATNDLSCSGNSYIGGVLTVGNGQTSSSITMYDSDEGNRTIHCNSNNIGFLTQAGGWGSYCTDDGSWYSSANMVAGGSVTASTVYTGWYRSTGNAGWYSETYGGGIWMTDTGYVRTYNNKSFWAHSFVEVANNYGTVSGAISIDPRNGSMVSMTLNAATTFTFTGAPVSGNAASFTLELTNGGSYTITWPSGTKWAGGLAPTLTASGIDILSFYTRDGGTTWRGVLVSKDNR